MKAEFIKLDTEVVIVAPPIQIASAGDQTALNSTKLSPFVKYVANRNTLVTFPLPATAAPGDTFFLHGFGSGKWKLTLNAGQIIHGARDWIGDDGEFIQAKNRFDTLEIICTAADTDFQIIGGSPGAFYMGSSDITYTPTSFTPTRSLAATYDPAAAAPGELESTVQSLQQIVATLMSDLENNRR